MSDRRQGSDWLGKQWRNPFARRLLPRAVLCVALTLALATLADLASGYVAAPVATTSGAGVQETLAAAASQVCPPACPPPPAGEGPCGAVDCSTSPPHEEPCGAQPCGQLETSGPCGPNPCASTPTEGPCGDKPCAPVASGGPCGGEPCPPPQALGEAVPALPVTQSGATQSGGAEATGRDAGNPGEATGATTPDAVGVGSAQQDVAERTGRSASSRFGQVAAGVLVLVLGGWLLWRARPSAVSR